MPCIPTTVEEFRNSASATTHLIPTIDIQNNYQDFLKLTLTREDRENALIDVMNYIDEERSNRDITIENIESLTKSVKILSHVYSNIFKNAGFSNCDFKLNIMTNSQGIPTCEVVFTAKKKSSKTNNTTTKTTQTGQKS